MKGMHQSGMKAAVKSSCHPLYSPIKSSIQSSIFTCALLAKKVSPVVIAAASNSSTALDMIRSASLFDMGGALLLLTALGAGGVAEVSPLLPAAATAILALLSAWCCGC